MCGVPWAEERGPPSQPSCTVSTPPMGPTPPPPRPPCTRLPIHRRRTPLCVLSPPSGPPPLIPSRSPPASRLGHARRCALTTHCCRCLPAHAAAPAAARGSPAGPPHLCPSARARPALSVLSLSLLHAYGDGWEQGGRTATMFPHRAPRTHAVSQTRKPCRDGQKAGGMGERTGRGRERDGSENCA